MIFNQLKLIHMNQVYAVWYDNGAQYAEDHVIALKKLFASEEGAKAYIDQRIADGDTYKDEYYITVEQIH
ncbi:MAG: hypothetical protein ACK52I_26600 [Pseudomonadota bacterium]